MRAFLIIVGLVVASNLLAAELYDVKVPDTITVGEKKLVLNGLGLRKAMAVFKVYVAALYVEKKSSDPTAIINSSGTRKLELHFKRYVEKKKLTEAWKKGFKKNKISGYDYRSDLTILNKAMTSMKEGEVIQMTFYPDHALIQAKDNEPLKIEGAKFAKQLLSVFLSSPPNAELKSGLLGLD